MPGCTADYCTNSSAKGFKMCSFPSDPERRQIWVKNMGRDNWTPTSNCRLCEVHFESTMWERQRLDGKKKLKFNAVPTLFGKHIPHRDATCDITPQSVEIADTSSNPSVISSEINLVEPETETEISSEGTVEFEATDTNIVSTDFSKSNEHLERMRKLLLKSERLRKKMKKKLISAKKTIKRLQSRI
ncbi:THAP domain-containing protein 5 [Diachasma alloeum]|uniref:THAP domain-containing protein 5 n=1 Tax=Diachasma alloeum TaxID=454923 RepID=UPI0007381422|nr:THAP domain-containing protein 5 [Diachasma alloeum]